MLRSVISGALLSVAIVVVPQACSEETNTLPAQSDSALGFAPGVEVPVGPFPRGMVDPAFALDPATQGPEIAVISPSRGAQLTTQTIDVRLRVEDVNGVANVSVNNIPAADLGSDEWMAQITLNPSEVNFIAVRAEDGLGNVATGEFSLVQGRFQPIDQYADGIVGLSLNNGGLQRAKMITEDLTRDIDLVPLLLSINPLFDNFLAEINIENLTHRPFQFEVSGQPDGAEIQVDLDDANLSLDIKALGSILKQKANILATTARATARCRVLPDLNNAPQDIKMALGLQIDQIEVELQGFDVTFSSGLLTAIVSLLRGTVRDLVEDELEDILGDLINDSLGGVVLPGLGQPLTVMLPIPVLGTSSIDLDFRASAANGSPSTGLGLSLGGRAVPTTQVLQNVTTDVFITGTTAVPNVISGDNFAVGLSSDAANAFMHALWLSGGLRLRLDGTNPQPDQTFALQFRLLTPFFPQLRGLAPDPNTPIVLEITTEAPPTARLGRNGASVELTASEFQVKVLIDYMDGQPPLDVMTLRANLQLTADIALVGNEIRITNLAAPVTNATLIEEPVTDLADQELVDFLGVIVPYALNRLQIQIPPIPIPALPLGLNLQNPRLEVLQDFVIVRGNL